jgi:phosphonopyruvate decarboxylase
MIEPGRVVAHLASRGVDMYTGVPDSLLKEFGKHVMAELPRDKHIIAANEGAAVGIALGHYLRTGRPALVYLQNSGFGNTVNPLLSLADADVYGVPMLLMIGWRGQPGVKDEPQHVKQGRVMTAMIEAMDLPYAVLPHDTQEAKACLTDAVKQAEAGSTPYVILVEKDTFAAAEVSPDAPPVDLASREDALKALANAVGDEAIIVSTTGMLSRELFEHREATGESGARDFLTVGGMGHASSIALGVAKQERDREVWCFDGDGALLMHLGSLAIIADHAPANYLHVVFNNGVHDSVGGQPTSIDMVDIPALAMAAGYRHAEAVQDLADVDEAIERLRDAGGPSLLELRVRPGNRPGIGRPRRTPVQSKQAFMDAVR